MGTKWNDMLRRTPPYGDGSPRPPTQLARWRGTRLAYLALGYICVGLAAIGAVLPVMPTTVFLIVAAWAFARSSERLNRWLHDHRLFGPLLRDWEDHGVIRPPAKIAAVATIALSFGIALLTGSPAWILAPLALVLGAVCLFILSRPSTPNARIGR